MVKALVIDDEPLARENIIIRLENYPEFTVCGQADNGHDALLLATKMNPDVIFLDIEMPGLTGVEAAKKIFEQLNCAIIFVTAYEEHAIEAFQINALDYLLKPFSDDRFEATLDRVKKHIALNQNYSPVKFKQDSYLKRLGIKDNKIISMVDVATIESIEVAGDYLCIVSNGKNHIHRQPLKSLLELLDPAKFVRIHRSHAVNTDYLDSVREGTDGLEATLKSGARFTVARRYHKAVRDQLKKSA